MTVYFIKRETSFGPFFSSQRNAIDYCLEENEDGLSPDEVAAIVEGRDPYTAIVRVELDPSFRSAGRQIFDC